MDQEEYKLFNIYSLTVFNPKNILLLAGIYVYMIIHNFLKCKLLIMLLKYVSIHRYDSCEVIKSTRIPNIS